MPKIINMEPSNDQKLKEAYQRTATSKAMREEDKV